jgi:hypothetical protein
LFLGAVLFCFKGVLSRSTLYLFSLWASRTSAHKLKRMPLPSGLEYTTVFSVENNSFCSFITNHSKGLTSSNFISRSSRGTLLNESPTKTGFLYYIYQLHFVELHPKYIQSAFSPLKTRCILLCSNFYGLEVEFV